MGSDTEEETEAIKEMYQPNRAPAYLMNRQAAYVNRLHEKQMGVVSISRKFKCSDGISRRKVVFVDWQGKYVKQKSRLTDYQIAKYPNGEMLLRTYNGDKLEEWEREAEVYTPKVRRKRRKATEKNPLGPGGASDDEFIVRDDEIDPPTRKRSRSKNGEEGDDSELSDEEEEGEERESDDDEEEDNDIQSESEVNRPTGRGRKSTESTPVRKKGSVDIQRKDGKKNMRRVEESDDEAEEEERRRGVMECDKPVIKKKRGRPPKIRQEDDGMKKKKEVEKKKGGGEKRKEKEIEVVELSSGTISPKKKGRKNANEALIKDLFDDESESPPRKKKGKEKEEEKSSNNDKERHIEKMKNKKGRGEEMEKGKKMTGEMRKEKEKRKKSEEIVEMRKKKRVRRMIEREDEDESSHGWRMEDSSTGSEMPSTSRHKSRTAYEIHKEKEMKRRRRKAKRKANKQEKQAKNDQDTAAVVREKSETSDGGSSSAYESESESDSDRSTHTAPSEPVSRDGSRANSPDRSRSGSCEATPIVLDARPIGSPIHGRSRSVSRGAATPPPQDQQVFNGIDPEKLRRKIQQMRNEEEEEKKKRREEEEKKKKALQSRPTRSPSPQLPPGQKHRVKAKVAQHRGRDPGILDAIPPSLASPRMAKGLPPSKRHSLSSPSTSTPSNNSLLDSIMRGMDTTGGTSISRPVTGSRGPTLGPPRTYLVPTKKTVILKGSATGSSIPRRPPVEIESEEFIPPSPSGRHPANLIDGTSPMSNDSPFLNPSAQALYAPSIETDESEVGEEERIVYGRANLCPTPQPPMEDDMHEEESTTPMDHSVQPDTTETMETHDEPSDGMEMRDGENGRDEREDNPHTPHSTSNDGIAGPASLDEVYLDGPSSPLFDAFDAPSSPAAMDDVDAEEVTSTNRGEVSAADTYGDNVNLDGPSSRELKRTREVVCTTPDPRRFQEVLSNLRPFIENGRDDGESETLITHALQWKMDTQGVNHFDNVNNRVFLLEMVKEIEVPSRSMMRILNEIFKWDSHNLNYESRRALFESERPRGLVLNECLTLPSCPHIERLYEDGRKDSYVRTPLSEAVMFNKLEWATFLIHKGAVNVNEVVSYPDYYFLDNYIVCWAVQNELLIEGKKSESFFAMVRLLLSKGANRWRARNFVEATKQSILRRNHATVHNFDVTFPQFSHLKSLLNDSVNYVVSAFKTAFRYIPFINDTFTIGWIRECMCTLPFDLLLNFPYVDDYFSEDGGLHSFAVLIGMSSDCVKYTRSGDEDIRIDSIVMAHPPNESPFNVSAELQEVREEGRRSPTNQQVRLKLEPMFDSHSLYVIPSDLLMQIKHLYVKMDEKRIDKRRVVYAALARLDMKKEIPVETID